jgi:hypothetical protein
MAAIVHPIITQHSEESAFLWVLRNNAIYSPHYALKDLAKLDTRIDAHLDGLRIAGAEGWKLCAEALASGEAGEVFAAGVMAFECIGGRIRGLEVSVIVIDHLADRGVVKTQVPCDLGESIAVVEVGLADRAVARDKGHRGIRYAGGGP